MIADCLIVRRDGSVVGAQLTGHEVVQAGRDPEVVALAPVMPVRDLAPRHSRATAQAAFHDPPATAAPTSTTIAVVGRAHLGPSRPGVDVIHREVVDGNGVATTLELGEALAELARHRPQVALVTVTPDLSAAVALLRQRGYSDEVAFATAATDLQATMRAIAALVARLSDTVVVAPAGDDSRRVAGAPGGGTLVPVSGLARLPSVLAVGAVVLHRAGLIVAPSANLYPDLVATVADDATSVTAAQQVAIATAEWWRSLGATASASLVRARLLAAATLGAFAASPDPADVGAGLVQAPR